MRFSSSPPAKAGFVLPFLPERPSEKAAWPAWDAEERRLQAGGVSVAA
ncbi:hypothetical protein [Kingella potus]|nr:hypothetical protein [Kingella potus]UOP00860.1 hypothetical protein LVJ84_14195 [Kingella potus]